LKLVFDGITNIFERLSENHITGKNEEERTLIEHAFRCLTHRVRKHIADKIGKDPGKVSEKKMQRKVNRHNPGMYNEEDIKAEREIRIKFDAQQTELSIAIGKLKELKKIIIQRKIADEGYKIFNMETENLEPDEDREAQPSIKLMERLEQMILNCFSKIDELVFGGRRPVTSADLEELCEVNNFDDLMEEWRNTINTIGEASVTKMRL
jgi:hypothetical protein